MPTPNQAVIDAKTRRARRARGDAGRLDWFADEVLSTISQTVEKRVKIAAEYLKSKIVRNISKPVKWHSGPKGGRVVTERSLPEEFPRADFTHLKNTIFTHTARVGNHVYDAYIGTPLDYGVILELKLNRSFLRRTLNEERATIQKMLSK